MPSRVALALVVACCVFAPLARGEAQARHPRVLLRWDDALTVAGCPDRAQVAAQAEERLRRPLGASSEAEAELVLDVHRVDASRAEAPRSGGHAFAAELALALPDGTPLGVRRIETRDPTCADLAAGLPLVIALLVDLHEAEAVLLLPPAAPPATFALPSPPPSSESPPPRAPLAVAGTLEVGLALDVGELPQPAFAPEVLVRLAPGDGVFSAVVRAALVVPQQSVDAGLDRSVTTWGGRGAAGGCAHAPVGAPSAPGASSTPLLALGGCALAEGGVYRVEGGGFDVSRAADALHLAALALASATLSLEALALRVEVGASVPLVLQRFVYDLGDQPATLFVSSPVGLRAALLAGVRFE